MSRNTSEMAIAMDVPREEAGPGLMSDLFVLTKARLNLMVIITTFVGFCAASGSSLNWLLLVNAVIGTTLAAGGAAVLNQVIESSVDRLMERTRFRPLPAGRVKCSHALILGIAMSALGVVWLTVAVNSLSAILAAATVLIYVVAYTPLKRRTALCTIVGAISGAIPPVIGWVAVKSHESCGVSWKCHFISPVLRSSENALTAPPGFPSASLTSLTA